MKLVSCDNCGVIVDMGKLEFGEWEDEVPITAYWDGDNFIPTAPCPVCQSRIIKI